MIVIVMVVDVFLVVPVVLYEVDRPPAGVVFGAMLLPVLLVPRTHVQIDRGGVGILGSGCHNHRLRVDDRRIRVSTDIDLTVEAGLSNRHSDIVGQCRPGKDGAQREPQNPIHETVLHVGHLKWPISSRGRDYPGVEALICGDGSSRQRANGISQVSVRRHRERLTQLFRCRSGEKVLRQRVPLYIAAARCRARHTWTASTKELTAWSGLPIFEGGSGSIDIPGRNTDTTRAFGICCLMRSTVSS